MAEHGTGAGEQEKSPRGGDADDDDDEEEEERPEVMMVSVTTPLDGLHGNKSTLRWLDSSSQPCSQLTGRGHLIGQQLVLCGRCGDACFLWLSCR